MFLVDENMSVKEIRKEINEILKPIKKFSDRWDIPFQYDKDIIKTDAIEDHINDLIVFVRENYDDDQRELALKTVR